MELTHASAIQPSPVRRGRKNTAVLLETIRRLYPELTRSQRKLADFMATSYRDAAFMTASRLASRLSLNEATVIRFAQRLGYAGYPDLIHDVRLLVHEELEAPLPVDDQAPRASMHEHLSAQVHNAQRFVSHISVEEADQAVHAVLAAQRIYVVGQGLAGAMAQMLSLALRSSGLAAECPSADPLILAVLGSEMGAGGLVIGISLEESPQIANLLAHARAHGALTLALTSSSVSPCARAADLAINCGHDDSTGLPSLTPIAVTIDALVQAVAGELGEQVTSQRLSIREAQAALARHAGDPQLP